MEPPFFWTARETEKPVKLLLRLLGEGLLLTSVVYSCLLLVLNDGASAGLGADEETTVAQDLLDRHWFFLGVIAGPLVETIFLQLIPIEIARRFSSRFWPQVLPSWILFAALHFTNSIQSGFAAGIIGGWYFALTYYLFRFKSTWHASMATFILHASSNFVLLCPD
jgi:hypothetical protein